jgi:energy-coupling factor transport system ATP-binding protein
MTDISDTKYIIELQNINFIYGEGTPFRSEALTDVSVGIERGKITGIIGHTGSGKSTLVQLLNGLIKPNSGTVLLDGRDIWAEPKKIGGVRFRVGLVFQYPEYQLFEETVRRDISFGPRNMGLPEDEIDRRVREAMAFVGLDEKIADMSPFELSGGQKRRVAIAGVIAMEPEVLVLDEPAAGLDPMGREEILGGVWSYQRRRRSTVVIVSHSMEDMARFCDRLIVMRGGRIHMTGTCSEVFAQTDKLTGTGLDIPQITRLMLALKARGADIDTDIFTIDHAKAVIENKIKQKRSGGKC